MDICKLPRGTPALVVIAALCLVPVVGSAESAIQGQAQTETYKSSEATETPAQQPKQVDKRKIDPRGYDPNRGGMRRSTGAPSAEAPAPPPPASPPSSSTAPKQAYCKDGHVLVTAGGQSFDCWPYKCNGVTACPKVCANINDCANPDCDQCYQSKCVPRTTGNLPAHCPGPP